MQNRENLSRAMRRKNYAFIGSSPSMLAYARAVSESAFCLIFEGGDLGGAWSESPFLAQSVPNATNAIGASEKFSDHLDPVIREMESLGARFLKLPGAIPGQSPGLSQHHYVGGVRRLIGQSLQRSNIELRRESVKSVTIHQSRAFVNEREFDGVFLPDHFYLPSLSVLGRKIEVAPNSITSRHIRLAFFPKLSPLRYTLDIDNVFDRGGFHFPNNLFFIGRVRRELKMEPLADLLSISEWVNRQFPRPIAKQEKLFRSDWHDAQFLQDLRNLLDETTSFQVATQDILEAHVIAKNFSRDRFG